MIPIGRYKNGNYDVLIFDDGTKIRQSESDIFTPDFAENIDIKITDCCDMGCPFCHEGSTRDGCHADLNAPYFNTLHKYQEVAIGGGNVLSHPELDSFLDKMKDMGIIANVTLNQRHFEKDFNRVTSYISEGKINGLGVSLVESTDNLIEKLKVTPNSVLHVINGIFSPKDYEFLKDKELKLLILGYKELRRGVEYLNGTDITPNQKWLKNILPELINHFDVVSLDNLAIEQLDVKRLMSDEQWKQFYMGADGTSTFYIDAVSQTFAKNSTAPMNERYPVLDSVDDMFNSVRT